MAKIVIASPGRMGLTLLTATQPLSTRYAPGSCVSNVRVSGALTPLPLLTTMSTELTAGSRQNTLHRRRAETFVPDHRHVDVTNGHAGQSIFNGHEFTFPSFA